MSKVLTREEARARLRRSGRSLLEIAREQGVSEQVARRVLSGRLKGHRGDAHRIAVALGLKDGVIAPPGMSATEALQMAGAGQ
jgi:gp16 family phage-associated protein